MRRTLTITAIAILLAGAAAIGQAADMDAQAGIDAQSTKFEQAFNSGDTDALAALYTEDAAVLPPGGARVDGRDGVKAFWAGGIGQGLGDLDLQTVEVMAEGDFATEVGTLSLTAPAAEGTGRTDLRGKYIVLWKRGEDGTWRLHRDIWNMGQ